MTDRNTVPLSLLAAREAFSTWDGFLAFGFGSGLLPKAPGTWGTLVALPCFLLLNCLGPFMFWAVLAGCFFLGVRICERVGNRLGVTDFQGIVWDEMVGFWLAVSLSPEGWYWLLLGFGVFRFFDIAKPWPISWVETRFDGGLGVMLDDVLAAIYTMILVGGVAMLAGSA